MFCRESNFEYSSCKFYNDDVTVTSFINVKYIDVATEILP